MSLTIKSSQDTNKAESFPCFLSYQSVLSLRKEFGFRAVIFLEQLIYWMNQECGCVHDGRKWIWNNITEWSNQTAISSRTLKRIKTSLRDAGILDWGFLHPNKRNRTCYYTINHDALSKYGVACQQQWPSPLGQNGNNNIQVTTIKLNKSNKSEGKIFHHGEKKTPKKPEEHVQAIYDIIRPILGEERMDRLDLTLAKWIANLRNMLGVDGLIAYFRKVMSQEWVKRSSHRLKWMLRMHIVEGFQSGRFRDFVAQKNKPPQPTKSVQQSDQEALDHIECIEESKRAKDLRDAIRAKDPQWYNSWMGSGTNTHVSACGKIIYANNQHSVDTISKFLSTKMDLWDVAIRFGTLDTYPMLKKLPHQEASLFREAGQT